MLTGRVLLMLVVMTATLATRQPAAASGLPRSESAAMAHRTTWVQRLGAGVTRSFSRIGLMQRVTLRLPAPRLSQQTGRAAQLTAGPTIDPLRTCLPPPGI